MDRMDSWQTQLARGVLLLTVLAAVALAPVIRWRMKLRTLVLGVAVALLILPVLIFLLVALSLGSTV
jgi:hypothetical protein